MAGCEEEEEEEEAEGVLAFLPAEGGLCETLAGEGCEGVGESQREGCEGVGESLRM